MKHIDRVQTGVRIEKRIVKVMKALAERLDMPLGELVEGVMLHAFEGRQPFGSSTIAEIALLRKVYGLDLTAADAHLLSEVEPGAK